MQRKPTAQRLRSPVLTSRKLISDTIVNLQDVDPPPTRCAHQPELVVDIADNRRVVAVGEAVEAGVEPLQHRRNAASDRLLAVGPPRRQMHHEEREVSGAGAQAYSSASACQARRRHEDFLDEVAEPRPDRDGDAAAPVRVHRPRSAPRENLVSPNAASHNWAVVIGAPHLSTWERNEIISPQSLINFLGAISM